MFAISHRVRKGMIMFWPYAIASIPSGWILCDGSNGTPDFRGRFPRGAWANLAPETVGGGLTHTHEFTGDGHYHSLASGPLGMSPGANANYTNAAEVTGTTDVGDSLPSFRAACFIMKL